jgi:hypothetical protein
MSCTENRTHTDGQLDLCGPHGSMAKRAGAAVSLAPGKRGYCQWKDPYQAPALDQVPEPDQDTSNPEPEE